jgi:hypothetical protein
MNNLSNARSTFKDQLAITNRKHTWVMSWLYIGTFGSFIGYSAAFPLLIKTQFPAITVAVAFLGPLVGSVARPFGGLLADKVGGARVTFWNFVAMGLATMGVMYYVDVKSFPGFLAMFLVLFVTTGIGNGSTFRMIPSIFREERLREAKGSVRPRRSGQGCGHGERRRHRFHLGYRRLRWLSHTAWLWRLDRGDRRPTPRSRGVSHLLHQLYCAHLVVLPASKLLCQPGADQSRSGARLRRRHD